MTELQDRVNQMHIEKMKDTEKLLQVYQHINELGWDVWDGIMSLDKGLDPDEQRHRLFTFTGLLLSHLRFQPYEEHELQLIHELVDQMEKAKATLRQERGRLYLSPRLKPFKDSKRRSKPSPETLEKRAAKKRAAKEELKRIAAILKEDKKEHRKARKPSTTCASSFATMIIARNVLKGCVSYLGS
jgi:hypothetical protein